MYADLVIQICNIQLNIIISNNTHNSSYPAQSSGLWWQNGYFPGLFLSVPLYYIVRNTTFCLKQSQGFEDLSSTQSLPKLPFSVPPVQKTKLHYTRWLLRRS